jgi:hypothetical protein
VTGGRPSLIAPPRSSRSTSRDELDLESQLDAVALADLVTKPVRRRAARRRPCLLVVDDEVCVLLGHRCAADPQAFSPASSMSLPADVPSGLRNTLPADGIPSGWCAAASGGSRRGLLDRVRVGRLERERRVQHELWGRIGRAVLEALSR